MRIFALCLAMMATTIVQASPSQLCNEHGAVVTLDDGTVLYLGKNCDAAEKGGSTGTWFNAASFLAVMLEDATYQVHGDIDCLPFCASQL